MKFNDKHILYGAGALMLILFAQKVIHNRRTSVTVNFDSVMMPNRLKPPTRLKEGDVVPKPAKRKLSLSGISFQKRFDTNVLF